jgi:hypothetical protein
MKFTATTTALMLMSAVVLQSCSKNNAFESWREQRFESAAPYAIYQGGRKSTEGRLANARGVIEERKGYYFLKSGRDWNLSDQAGAKKFANSQVSVWGFFDYDKGMIDVAKMFPLKK